MPDSVPLARSPIACIAPGVVVDGWEVTAQRSTAAQRITDCTPLAKVLVHAPANGPVAKALGVPFGRLRRDESSGVIIGSGPGEWLLLGPPSTAPALAAKVQELGHSDDVSAVDVTHARAMIRLVGDRAAPVLSKVCAIDFDDSVTPNGAALRSSVAGVVTDIVRHDLGGDRSYLLHSERSFGQYLFDALVDAGREYGFEIDGFRSPGI